MSKQIGFNKPTGGISPRVTAQYHKVGWKDILDANRLPHFGIIVITDADTDKLSERPLPHADEPYVRESEGGIFPRPGQGVGISGNFSDL